MAVVRVQYQNSGRSYGSCYGLTQKLHGRVTNPAYLCTRSTYETAATPLFLQRCATPRDTVIRE